MTIDHRIIKYRILPVTVSIVIQTIIGLFLGHLYDMEIFFTAGHAVSHGIQPYGLFATRTIFGNPAFFEELPGIGYPPPWAIYLGLIYKTIYETTRSIFIYNLAVKIPSIIANIALAFVVERIAVQQGLDEKNSRKIFYFFLFNPFMIYVSAAWGQFDSLVILVTVLALNDLHYGRIIRSSFLTALSVSLKILPLILAPMILLFLWRNCDLKTCLRFALSSFGFFLVFSYLPFVLLDWDIGIILSNLGFHFNRAGCLTLFNVIELLYDSTNLPQGLEFLGYLWIPALILTYSMLSRTSLTDRMSLFRWASALFFVLMLTRSWVSEQNIIFLIPLVVLESVVNSRKWFTANLVWAITFLFSVINTSPFQMFFLLSTVPIEMMKQFDLAYRIPRLVLKFLVVIPWGILGLRYVLKTTSITSKYSRGHVKLR
jgi:hypothetical protein